MVSSSSMAAASSRPVVGLQVSRGGKLISGSILGGASSLAMSIFQSHSRSSSSKYGFCGGFGATEDGVTWMLERRFTSVWLFIELRSVCVELGSLEWLITENVSLFTAPPLGWVVNTIGRR